MLINILGKDYIVWDKSAKTRFKCPRKRNVICKIHHSDECLEEIKFALKNQKSFDKIYKVELKKKLVKSM